MIEPHAPAWGFSFGERVLRGPAIPAHPLVLSRTPLLPLRCYLPHIAPVPTEFYLIHSPYWSPIEPGALEALSVRFQVIDSFAVRDLSVLHLRTK